MNKQVSHIPSGYKPSPLGPIPEDWEVKRLEEVGSFSKGSGVPKDKIISEGHPCLTYGDLYTKYDFVIKNIKSFIDEETSKESKEINAGDICFAGSGETPEDIGKCAAYLENCPAYAGGDIVILSPNNNINSLWLSYLLNSDIGGKQRYKFAQGFSIVHIYPDNLKQIQIPVPPLSEQQRIVSVLSLWDTAIAKQTALIEKLTLRKRGLMQQLLTGKKRLKGFCGEWKNIKLGSIAERITRKNEEDNKNVVTISAQRGFVVQTDFFNKSVASEILDNYFLVHKNEFCYNKSHSNGYPMGAIKRLKSFDKAVVTTLYICFKLKEKPQTNIDFFEQYCESGLLNKELVKVANEGGRAHGLLNVTPADFFNMHMRIPSIEEQTAIASVLVNADKEIEIQKQKLAAMQEQKRGLMQVLLSGKRRVE
jgi:type I restriction enzyme S subunit